ncbi:MAG: RsiV family protein [Treponema sp.]|jgi:hypothetical protein|nr:RsiV family protein [Treponema sp.]
MKYLTIFFILPFMALISCRSVPKSAADFSPYVQEKTIFLFPDRAEHSPRMSISLNALEFVGNVGLQECIYRVLYDGLVPARYGDTLIDSWKERYANAADGREKSYGESFNWEYIETIEAADVGRVVQVKRTRYEYTGGAHGDQREEFYLFDKIGKDGNTPHYVILNDIIPLDAHADLLQIVELRLRKDEGLTSEAPLSENGFLEDVIEMPSGFSLALREGASSGVVFHWNPYEIAPYVRGQVETLVPYEEIESLLTSYGRDLLK